MPKYGILIVITLLDCSYLFLIIIMDCVKENLGFVNLYVKQQMIKGVYLRLAFREAVLVYYETDISFVIFIFLLRSKSSFCVF